MVEALPTADASGLFSDEERAVIAASMELTQARARREHVDREPEQARHRRFVADVESEE